MKAEQAWQATLGQLQMDMQKAAYDTWVRDSELVTYEDGVFIIGVKTLRKIGLHRWWQIDFNTNRSIRASSKLA